MSRPRIPTSVLDAKGAFIANPQRKRANEPTTDRSLGRPPKTLDIEHAKIWKDLQRQLLPGVAKVSDRIAFEALTNLVYRLRKGTLSGHGYSLLLQFSGRFAMTPSDRSKVAVDTKPASKLDKFMNRPKPAPAPVQ
jgi:hypothetical protein